MAQVAWTDSALADLEAIRTYLARFDPTAGNLLASAVARAGDELAADPALGQPAGDGERVLAVPPFHALRYRATGDDVTILRLTHAGVSDGAFERAVIERAHVIVWIHVDSKVVFINPYAVRVLGLESPAQIVGRDYISLVHPDHHARSRERVRRIIAADEVVAPAEIRLIRPDGGVLLAEMQGIPIVYDGAVGCLSMGRDVTEHRQAAEALRHSEARFRDFAEIASDWLWELGPDLQFTYLSKEAPELGITATKPLLDSPVEQVPPSVDPDVMRRHLEDLHARRAYRNFRYTWRDSGGRVHHMKSSGKPLFDEAGTFLGFRGVGVEVTPEVEAEEKLRQAQKMDSVGQLTGGIAHDFNNLLTVIIGTTEQLLETIGPGEERLLAMVREIEQAGERGAGLVHRLLAFSRQQTLHPQRVEVNRLVASLEPLLRRTLGETIEIHTALAEPLWPTLADPGQIENSLLNLAVNARDAMPRGGRLAIETRNVQLDDSYSATASELQPGAYVLLAVSDSGTGMTPEVCRRAFDPFFTTKEKGKGTGLGLAMIYGFAKQSGGHATIYSEVGVGTTVKLYLPRLSAGAPEAAGEAAAAAAPAVGGGETVLLVEDDGDVRSAVRRQLAALGYAVVEAPSGAAAAAMVANGASFDALLTDMVMPAGIDGWELAQIVWHARPEVPVLLMTGYTDNAILQRVRAEQRVRVLSKPFRQRELAAAVRQALDGRQHP